MTSSRKKLAALLAAGIMAFTPAAAATENAFGFEAGQLTISASAASAPASSKPRSIASNTSQTQVKFGWQKVSNCTGYAIYAYNITTNKWVCVANVTDKNTTSIILNTAQKYSGAAKSLSQLKTGGCYGYRFCVRTYVKSGGKYTYGKPVKMSTPYYNINAVTNYFENRGKQYTLLKKAMSANATGKTRSSYKVYTTGKKNGRISSTYYTYTISDKERAAIEKFAKSNFKSSWSDAQKIAYTVNWVNRNVKYDYPYANGNYSFCERTFNLKSAQCDGYNGTIASMLTYLGYKNVYLQCMDPTVRNGQHFVTHIVAGGKTYTIEAGNMDSSGDGWIALCEDNDEVPLN